MQRSISAILVLLPLCALPLPAAAPSVAGELPTCRGLTATHVGVPGEDLTTTAGDDVVVTNGARDVRTLGGNDVVCATRARLVHVVPGAGDDVIDTTGYHGTQVDADLGEKGADGSTGDDTYYGGKQWDEITISSGTRGDQKVIDTGDHFDALYVHGGYPGGVTASMGEDNDSVTLARPRANVDIDGGSDFDDYYTFCARCSTASFDLDAGPIEVGGRSAGSAVGFEYFRVFHVRHQMTAHVTVTGSDLPEYIDVSACSSELHGAGGTDNIGAYPDPDLCDEIESRAFGDQGDDSVYGTNGRDLLRGGAGDDALYGRRGRDDLGGEAGLDEADGGPGPDNCRAEVKVNCER